MSSWRHNSVVGDAGGREGIVGVTGETKEEGNEGGSSWTLETRVREFQMEVCLLKHSREGLKIDKGIIGNYGVVLINR